MTFCVGTKVTNGFRKLIWNGDFDSQDIFGEEYPNDYVIGYYTDLEDRNVSYYIDTRDGVIIAKFTTNKYDETTGEWSDDYAW